MNQLMMSFKLQGYSGRAPLAAILHASLSKAGSAVPEALARKPHSLMPAIILKDASWELERALTKERQHP